MLFITRKIIFMYAKTLKNKQIGVVVHAIQKTCFASRRQSMKETIAITQHDLDVFHYSSTGEPECQTTNFHDFSWIVFFVLLPKFLLLSKSKNTFRKRFVNWLSGTRVRRPWTIGMRDSCFSVVLIWSGMVIFSTRELNETVSH